jgi:uncharacterized protein (DUF2132 family)
MTDEKPKKPRTNKYPAQGLTLEMMVTKLVEVYGWERLGEKINIRCFNFDPSIKSSLTFLRKTPWAREEVEALYQWRDGRGWNPKDDHK